MLDNGTSAVVSWAMDGLLEGIDLALRPSHPGKCPVIGRSQQMGPHVLQVPIHPGDRLLPDRHHAVLLPLALTHHQHSTFAIQVVHRQVQHVHRRIPAEDNARRRRRQLGALEHQPEPVVVRQGCRVGRALALGAGY